LVKLIRVLMLGPVCVVLSLVTGTARQEAGAQSRPKKRLPAFHRLVPWFIIGFLAMVVLRTVDVIPTLLFAPIATAATVFTVISMAALGLGVDIRTVSRAGLRVTITAILSLVMLGSASFGLIRLLHL
jgi:uncharacterized membrane protein YadS